MDSKTKKLTTEQWVKDFPDLSLYTQNKLYKIIGPFVFGIELIKLPRIEEYRPHFVIYSLWKNDAKSCFEYPVLLQEFFNNKQLTIDIPYKDINGKYYNEAKTAIYERLKTSFMGNITLNEFYALIDDAMQLEIRFKSHSGKIASLFELKYYAALYIGGQPLVQNVLNQIQTVSKNWNLHGFELWYGNFDTWIQGLQKKIDSREEFLNQIKANKQDKKISKLKCSELIA